MQRPETLVSAVARSISEAIMHGELSPGQALPEPRLAAELGTSRGTVREALRLLGEQGLVDIFLHRGAFVATLTPQKAHEISTLRANLESFAVRLAMDHDAYTRDALSDLEAALGDLKSATSGSDLLAIADADMHFHDILSQASGHELLLDVLLGLRLQMRYFIVYTKLVDSDREPESITHARILEAIKTGDAEIAAAAVHRHIIEAGDQLSVKLNTFSPIDGSPDPVAAGDALR
ncbi:MAG: GntR family transcriptional regulator [Thermomicrobia bacterium]|nr:GntR family transcriptional regulator [Thermomicrobia bacterium]MCA1724493.1 GntR family transcriptional regulator [Thermomicrobia bacterium]